MGYARRKSRLLHVGSVAVGGTAPIAVQSMNASPAHDFEANLEELGKLAAAGCEISRFSVPDEAAAAVLKKLCERSPLPLVADIHFDYRLALLALEAGAAALRLNPGNIHSREGLKEIARAASARQVPIRVGVNAGSLDPRILREEGGVTAKALKRSALEAAALLEETGFHDICLSLKASNPRLCIEATRLVAEACDYPLHLGVTEAGFSVSGVIRSAVGIGTLLAEGIGDTLRVSLTDEPVEEVRAAWLILSALSLRERGPTLISCPGCGRTQVDIRQSARAVEDYLKNKSSRIKVAVMGCAVNGPGEAREADLGLAGGRGEFLLFKKGKIIRKMPESDALSALFREIDAFIEAEHSEADKN